MRVLELRYGARIETIGPTEIIVLPVSWSPQMPVDHVQFCTKKYLKNSYGFRSAAVRPDLVEKANGWLTANATGIGAVLGVQTIAEDSDEIAFIVGENGLFLADIARACLIHRLSGPAPNTKTSRNSARLTSIWTTAPA
ncbi:hypothetical protein [Bradyrhizobium sp. Leo121]|uniref:hypothetical protein n=1 Tax=Bradyrhizobium sp. Leo121 TaxID=1571195 RepID=UPI001028AF0A|nr:hypothetical protein [Bradyrhizobium sp. Leo121]